MNNSPIRLRLRDTGLHDDLGGGGQRIWTTAGQGYPKIEFVEAAHADRLEREVAALREALTDDLFAREIQMQLRPYEPISEEKVREQFEDIRQGIAIYLDEHGLATEPHAQGNTQ